MVLGLGKWRITFSLGDAGGAAKYSEVHVGLRVAESASPDLQGSLRALWPS